MKLDTKNILTITFFLAIILIILIPISRSIYGKPMITSDEHYHHKIIADQIREGEIPTEEQFILRPYIIQPYDFILAGMGHLFEDETTSVIIGIISGLLSIIIFYYILKELNILELDRLIILISWIISPIFVFVFVKSNNISLTITLLLIGICLFMKKHNASSIIIFAILPFFGVLPCIIGVSLLLIYSLNNKRFLKRFYIILATNLILLLAYQLPFLYNYGFPNGSELLKKGIMVNLISGLGGEIGFGVFHLLLGIIGMYLMWKIKKQILGYALFFIFGVFSFYDPMINIYLNLVLAIFSGFAFSSIIKMKWKINLIKKITIALVICGFLLSTLSYVNRTIDDLPDEDTFKSLEWLKENSNKEDIIFSHYSKGMWIESISNRQVIMDSKFEYLQDLKNKQNLSDNIFYSRNLRKTRELLGNLKIKYIFIDSSMKEGQVWSREDEGLLFLFRNKETFKKVYDEKGIEIWEFLD